MMYIVDGFNGFYFMDKYIKYIILYTLNNKTEKNVSKMDVKTLVYARLPTLLFISVQHTHNCAQKGRE